MKDSKTGGRLIRLLASYGYVYVMTDKKYHYPVLLLTKLTRDRVSANEFLTWTAKDKLGNWFKAVNTDLVDLNEKLLEYGFPPLIFEIDSRTAEEKGQQLLDNFGNKVEVKE